MTIELRFILLHKIWSRNSAIVRGISVLKYEIFGVFTLVSLTIQVVCIAMSCRLVNIYRHFEAGVHSEIFAGEGAHPEAIYNLCLILKIML
jgi:hypothetical protein